MGVSQSSLVLTGGNVQPILGYNPNRLAFILSYQWPSVSITTTNAIPVTSTVQQSWPEVGTLSYGAVAINATSPVITNGSPFSTWNMSWWINIISLSQLTTDQIMTIELSSPLFGVAVGIVKGSWYLQVGNAVVTGSIATIGMHNIIVTVGASGWRLFVDNVLVCTSTSSLVSRTTYQVILSMGNIGVLPPGFAIPPDHMGIYDWRWAVATAEWSPSTISAIYNNGVQSFNAGPNSIASGLSAFVNMTDGSGNTMVANGVSGNWTLSPMGVWNGGPLVNQTSSAAQSTSVTSYTEQRLTISWQQHGEMVWQAWYAFWLQLPFIPGTTNAMQLIEWDSTVHLGDLPYSPVKSVPDFLPQRYRIQQPGPRLPSRRIAQMAEWMQSLKG